MIKLISWLDLKPTENSLLSVDFNDTSFYSAFLIFFLKKKGLREVVRNWKIKGNRLEENI